ncbi:MAG: hypothetical protein M1826_001168 [Phylliscum demangeonii]|nr:MAG: hypothetical protein M1826_001168 [Phylliscum demangeonii]
MGSAAVAAPLAAQQPASKQNGANRDDFHPAVAASALAGGAIVGLTGKHYLNKKQKELSSSPRVIQYLKSDRDWIEKLASRNPATIRGIEDLMSPRDFQQLVKRRKEIQRARVGQILRANGPQWICMYHFLQARVSAWNEAANDCDQGKDLPGLRVTGSREASFQLPEKLWLPDEKKSSQFALRPAHKKGLLQSLAHQAQRSLHPFTRTPALAASMLQKAENFGKKTVGEMERVEAF